MFIFIPVILCFIGCSSLPEQKDDAKFDSLENLSERWLKSNCDSAMIYSRMMMKYSEEGNNSKQLFRAAKMNGRVFEIIGKHDSAILYFRKMIDFSKKGNDTSEMLEACNRIYLAFSNLQENDSASFWMRRGKYISKAKHDTLNMAIFESSLGQFYQDNGVYDSAQICFLNAAKYFELTKDSVNTAFSFRNIGNTLKFMGMSVEAAKYYKMALNLQQSLKNIVESGIEMSNIATTFKTRNPDSAQIYFIWSLKLLEETGSIESKLQVNFNYANLLKSQNKYKEALAIYQDVYDKSLENNILRGQLLSLNLMAKTYAAMKNNAEASKFFQQAIKLAKQKSISTDLIRLYKEAFTFYLETGDVENARDNFDEWEILSDSLKSVSQMENVIRYQTLYESEKKESENHDLRNSVQIKARNNIIYMILGLVLFAFLIFILYVFQQRTRYLKLLVSRAQLQIEQYSTQSSLSTPEVEEKQQESELVKAIINVLDEEKLFCNTQLTLEMLAGKVNTNRKTLSSTINNYFAMNFNSLINFYRVEFAKKLLIDQEYRNIKMEAIGYKSGFSTRQCFYLSFNKYVGMSPAEFQQINKKHQDTSE
jgi:AraC-like DNA-binding protein